MKHIRKFNENTDNSLDVAYISHCFNDMVEYAYNDFENIPETPGNIVGEIRKIKKLKKMRILLSVLYFLTVQH